MSIFMFKLDTRHGTALRPIGASVMSAALVRDTGTVEPPLLLKDASSSSRSSLLDVTPLSLPETTVKAG